MTNARFLVHQGAGTGHVVWWAESSDVPGMSIAADTLTELRRLIQESVEAHVGANVAVSMDMADLDASSSRTKAV